MPSKETQERAMTPERYDELIGAMREAHGPFYISLQEMETLLRLGAAADDVDWLRSAEATDVLARQIYEYSEKVEGATWVTWEELDEKLDWLAVAEAFLGALADARPKGADSVH